MVAGGGRRAVGDGLDWAVFMAVWNHCVGRSRKGASFHRINDKTVEAKSLIKRCNL